MTLNTAHFLKHNYNRLFFKARNTPIFTCEYDIHRMGQMFGYIWAVFYIWSVVTASRLSAHRSSEHLLFSVSTRLPINSWLGLSCMETTGIILPGKLQIVPNIVFFVFTPLFCWPGGDGLEHNAKDEGRRCSILS